jgi:hypothetical protein
MFFLASPMTYRFAISFLAHIYAYVDMYERRCLKAFQLNVIYVADRWLDVIFVNKALRARHDSYKCCLIVVRRAQKELIYVGRWTISHVLKA